MRRACARAHIALIQRELHGVANVHIEDSLVKLIGPHSVIGRSVVVSYGYRHH